MRQNAKENTLFPANAGQWHGFRPGWLAFSAGGALFVP